MKFIASFCVLNFLIIFWIGNALAQSSETPITSQNSSASLNYGREIEEIRTENKILKERIDVLNSTNDKILDSIYWTIGAILTALFGLTVWNGIKNRNLDEERFKIILEKSKKELNDSLGEKLNEAVKKTSFSDLSSIKLEINKSNYEAERFKLYYIKRELKYHPFWNIQDDNHLFEYYFNFVVSKEMVGEYKYLLETVINFLKSDPYMALDDRNKILNFIDTKCSEPQYNLYVSQVKKSLENLE